MSKATGVEVFTSITKTIPKIAVWNLEKVQPTPIKHTTVGIEPQKGSRYYDLQGRITDRNSKGIVINNGRKYINH